METDFVDDLQSCEQPMTAREKELKDWFVREYLIDYNFKAAAIRIGFNDGLAAEYGQKFRYDPYVQRQITQSMRAEPHDKEAVESQRSQQIMGSLVREANYSGPGASHSARVTALSKLATIHGMDAPTKTKVESVVTHKGKVDMEHTFDFSTLTDEERELVRTLLKGQVDDAN